MNYYNAWRYLHCRLILYKHLRYRILIATTNGVWLHYQFQCVQFWRITLARYFSYRHAVNVEGFPKVTPPLSSDWMLYLSVSSCNQFLPGIPPPSPPPRLPFCRHFVNSTFFCDHRTTSIFSPITSRIVSSFPLRLIVIFQSSGIAKGVYFGVSNPVWKP